MWIHLRDQADVDRLQQALLVAPLPENSEQALAHNQDLTTRLARQVEDRHRVVREVTFEGTEAEVREQLGRSMPDGVTKPGRVIITARTISNSLPGLEPFVEPVGSSLSDAARAFLQPYKHGDRPWRELDIAELVAFVRGLSTVVVDRAMELPE